MSPILVFSIIAAYFIVLIVVSQITSKNATNESFFTGDRESHWFVVAFGMIGTTLSGITFISIPGEVGVNISSAEPTYKAFSYFQMVLGYVLGYVVIANVLMPMYYKLNLVSIYSYLDTRFGISSYKTGSLFFLLSQSIGASLRLFLVAVVLQIGFFDAYNIPFFVTVLVTILLIWLYTARAGIKTIVWTGTLQTFFMVLAVIITVFAISNTLDLSSSGGLIKTIEKSEMSKIFFWDWKSSKYFFKQFFAGAFIAITMTGLDQAMMQRNLTCRNIGEAKKNMYWFTAILVPVNLLFLSLGVMLYLYAAKEGIVLPERSDDLYPILAMQHFSPFIGIVFLLGIIAAAFSSADSSLTSLTTSFCVDILDQKDMSEKQKKKQRLIVHIGFSVLLFIIIIIFKIVNNESVVTSLFKLAGYTYGPLLGLYFVGLFTKWKLRDKLVPAIAIIAPVITFFISKFSSSIIPGYIMGFEIILVNGIITFLGLLLIRKKSSAS